MSAPQQTAPAPIVTPAATPQRRATKPRATKRREKPARREPARHHGQTARGEKAAPAARRAVTAAAAARTRVHLGPRTLDTPELRGAALALAVAAAGALALVFPLRRGLLR